MLQLAYRTILYYKTLLITEEKIYCILAKYYLQLKIYININPIANKTTAAQRFTCPNTSAIALIDKLCTSAAAVSNDSQKFFNTRRCYCARLRTIVWFIYKRKVRLGGCVFSVIVVIKC